jgi:glutamyl-tRNA synthetase
LGLEWDEGPDKGGPYAPYRQSERRAIYREHVARLIAAGRAYPCFCTEARLDELKQRQAAAKLPPRYDGRCRDLDETERADRIAAGEPHTVRFRTPNYGELTLPDLIRGRVQVALKNLDDFILVRSNGNPGFILAGAIDDHLMGITHVLRGEDHLTNTHKQMLIFQALDREPPRYGHLPLIVGDDGRKLSKRLGDLSLAELRAQGYHAEVLAAHLARLGWAAPNDAESLTAMAAAFDVERVAKKPARIGLPDLAHRESRWLRRLDASALAVELRPYLGDVQPPNLPAKAALFAEEAHTLRELADKILALETLATTPTVLTAETAKIVVNAFASELTRLAEFDAVAVRGAMTAVSDATGAKGKALFQPIRLALQGAEHGPDLAALIVALGRGAAVARLRQAATAR